jgi:hypothetical protein
VDGGEHQNETDKTQSTNADEKDVEGEEIGKPAGD